MQVRLKETSLKKFIALCMRCNFHYYHLLQGCYFISFIFQANSHHNSFGGGLFDFDPEDYYHPPPTRPPRPDRPPRRKFQKPPRPSHGDFDFVEDEYESNPPSHTTTVIYRPKPTHYPPRPPPVKPVHQRPQEPQTIHQRPPPLQEPQDFYPPYRPPVEENEVDGSLNTASRVLNISNYISTSNRLLLIIPSCISIFATSAVPSLNLNFEFFR